MSSPSPTPLLKCRCDAHGVVREADAAWDRVLGLKPARVEGWPLAERIHADDHKALARMLLGADGTPETLRLIGAEGTPLQATVTARPGPDGSRWVELLARPTVESLADALRAARHLRTTLVERAGEAIFIKDRDLRYTFINEAGARLLDRTPEDVLGRDDHALFFDGTADEIVEIDKQIMRSGESFTYRPTRHEFGEARVFLTTKHPYLDEDGHLAGVMGVSHDVTPWVRAQERALKADQGFRALIEAAPDLIFVCAQDRAIAYANPAACSLFLPPTGTLVGTHIDDLFQNNAPTGDPDGRAWECDMVRPDGTRVPAEAVATPVNWLGEPAWALLVRDLSERRNLEARLAQADRLATVGTLAGGVAHEINNPLTFVGHQVHAVGLALEAGGTLDRSDLLRRITEAASGVARINAIVRDLSTFARDDDDGPAAIDVHDLLERALQLAQLHVRHKARLVRDFEDVPTVLGRAGRLSQVFLNLLVNAAQALPTGHTEANQITVGTRTVDDMVAISITDTGPGITPDVLSQVFECAFTTKAPGEGTGLGLWLSRGFVREMGGVIRVESVPGEGATFTVLLPATAGPPVASPGPDPIPPTPAPAPQRYRLFVVDDEPVIGEIIGEVFSAEADVRIFTSGREALTALLEAVEPPDALLCDIVMPDLDGISLFRELEAHRPELAARTLFLTGGAVTESSRLFLAEHTNRVVTKPFSLKALLTAVRAIAFGVSSAN